MTARKTTDHAAIIKRWVAAMNSHDPEAYLAFFTDDAVLDDPSVGDTFTRKAGIGRYFDAYFIGYKTRTRIVRITPTEEGLHVEAHFTGDFPGGKTGGIFDVTFTGDKISFVHADLAE